MYGSTSISNDQENPQPTFAEKLKSEKSPSNDKLFYIPLSVIVILTGSIVALYSYPRASQYLSSSKLSTLKEEIFEESYAKTYQPTPTHYGKETYEPTPSITHTYQPTPSVRTYQPTPSIKTFQPTPSIYGTQTYVPTPSSDIDTANTPSTTFTIDTDVVKPNFVFILADDLGWNSIGYQEYDLSFTTPFLSQLAQRGVIMDNYYAQEMCTPSRASLLTGRYPLSIGIQYHMIQQNNAVGLNLNETTIADVLQENGYKTYLYGKWDLGHFSPRFLPTARGFDYFTGFLTGETNYWSKKNPMYYHFKDFMTSDSKCYAPYEDDDMHTYSTFLYRNKAVQTIADHDVSDPLFLLMSFQAVHNPFSDINQYQNGIPKEYIKTDIYEKIITEVQGRNRRQYAMALTLMDEAVSDIYDALQNKGMLDSTYIIFASDNGGCYVAGGKNGPLRGTKGSLFEGGVKVDAFVFSNMLPSQIQGTRYSDLMHTSDWFPTMLKLAGITYTPFSSEFDLDGVSQVQGWLGGEVSRDYVLYNDYYNVDGSNFNMWTNGSFAIRDKQYKLMHVYNSDVYGAWYNAEDILDTDDDIQDGSCNEGSATRGGDFVYYLFDLNSDPYETTNLYDSDIDEHKAAKEDLYNQLEVYREKSREVPSYPSPSKVAFPTWKLHDDTIVPWENFNDVDMSGEYSLTRNSYPRDCYVATDATSKVEVEITKDEDEVVTTDPTLKSTIHPTQIPSSSSTRSPTLAEKSTLFPTFPPAFQR